MNVFFDVVAVKRAPLYKGYMLCVTFKGGKHEFQFFVCTGKDGTRICRFTSAPNQPISTAEWVKVKDKAEKLDGSNVIVVKASLAIKNEDKEFRKVLAHKACTNKNIIPAFAF